MQGFVGRTGERRIRWVQSGTGDDDQKQRGRNVKHAAKRDFLAAWVLMHSRSVTALTQNRKILYSNACLLSSISYFGTRAHQRGIIHSHPKTAYQDRNRTIIASFITEKPISFRCQAALQTVSNKMSAGSVIALSAEI